MHLSPGKRISRLVTVRPHSPFNHRYVHHVSNRWPIYFNQLTHHKSATSTVKLNPNIRPCLGPPSYRKPTTVEHPICFMIKTTIKDCQVPIESYWIYTHIYMYIYICIYIYIHIISFIVIQLILAHTSNWVFSPDVDQNELCWQYTWGNKTLNWLSPPWNRADNGWLVVSNICLYVFCSFLLRV